jgi:hypothetical protein
MKTKMLKFLIMALMVSLIGAGAASAGGYKSFYKAPGYGGYYKPGGYYHHGPYHRYSPGYWHNRYPCYGPPVRCYPHHHHYYRGYNRYGGAYFFSGAFPGPGFGFVFGTRGSW